MAVPATIRKQRGFINPALFSGNAMRISPIFSAALQSTLVPSIYGGSSTPTYARGSAAYVADWEALLKPVLSGEARFTGARRVYNLLALASAKSEDLTSGWTTAAGDTVAATTLSIGVGNTRHDVYDTNAASISVPNGAAIVARAKFKPITGTTYHATFAIGTGTGVGYITVNMQTGAITQNANSGAVTLVDYGISSAVDASGYWTATLKVTATDSATGGVYLVCGFANGSTYTNGSAFVGNGTDVMGITQLQLENVQGQSNTIASEYVSYGAAAAPYHGAGVDGVAYPWIGFPAAANPPIPCLNGNTNTAHVFVEATGAAIKPANGSSTATTDASGPFGLLKELASTNLLTYSNDVTNAAWVKTTLTTALTSTGPDGVANSATRVTATGANSLALQTYVAAASSRTYSLWVKRITGSGNFDLTQDGVAFTTVTTTAGWTVVQLNASQLNAVVGFRIVTSGDAFDVWCNQFEAGAVATSPIPTTTVAVTRAIDALTYTTASNFSDTAGTMYSEVLETSWASVAGTIIGSATQGMLPLTTNNGVSGYDGTNTVNGTAGAPSGVVKMAVAWTGTTMTVTANGTAVVSGTYDTTWNLATLGIGTGTNANIRNVKIYGEALSNAALVTLTTP